MANILLLIGARSGFKQRPISKSLWFRKDKLTSEGERRTEKLTWEKSVGHIQLSIERPQVVASLFTVDQSTHLQMANPRHASDIIPTWKIYVLHKTCAGFQPMGRF